MHGHLDSVKFLVDEGADLNAKDSQEFTPLDAAIRGGQDKVVEYLVEKG
jgi:ankyrin repeat protein